MARRSSLFLVALCGLGLCAGCAQLPQTGAQELDEAAPYPRLINTLPLQKSAEALSAKSQDDAQLRAAAESLRARAENATASAPSQNDDLRLQGEALRARAQALQAAEAQEDAARAAALLKKAQSLRATSGN